MSIFLLSVVLILAAASLVIRKSVPAIISFALMMLMLGIYYITLDAKLLGLFQIFVYTGGIIVLMLFGVTVIGVEFPPAKARPWAAFGSLLVFIALSALFLRTAGTLATAVVQNPENVQLFATQFGDFIILFALIGSSLLYGTVKMAKILQAKRSRNV